jgi:predicted transcriptional regulator of viral defense system
MYNKHDYQLLYKIAEGQSCYFTSAQARRAGFSWERFSANVKTGKFLRVTQGVYRLVQFPASKFEDLFVAWLRVGESAVISHQSALALYQLTDVIPGEVHLVIPRTTSRRHPGLRLHTNRLLPDDVTTREGLPVTSPARTIVDAAASSLAEEQVLRAIQEVLAGGLVTVEELVTQAD